MPDILAPGQKRSMIPPISGLDNFPCNPFAPSCHSVAESKNAPGINAASANLKRESTMNPSSQSRVLPLLCVIASLILTTPVLSQAPEPTQKSPPLLQVIGLEIPVHDLDKALRFYEKGLQFEVREKDDDWALLQLGAASLLLTTAPKSSDSSLSPPLSGAYLNFRVENLDHAVAKAMEFGGRFADLAPQPFALGKVVAGRDPSGISFNVLRIDGDTVEGQIAVFNLGIVTEEIAVAEEFYTGLGSEVYSRDWLPRTLPLQNCGPISLVLHDKIEDPGVRHHRNSLVLMAKDPEAAIEELEKRSMFPKSSIGRCRIMGKEAFSIFDPYGNRLKIIPSDNG